MSEDLTNLNVSGRSVGIIGFKAILVELGPSMARAADEPLARELLNRVSGKNYVPDTAREDYGKALVREFRRHWGQSVPEEKPAGLVIRVLGQGCNNCRELTRRIMDVLTELNRTADLEHVTDIKEIARYGILGSPALIINGRVLAVGSVPAKKQLAEWLKG